MLTWYSFFVLKNILPVENEQLLFFCSNPLPKKVRKNLSASDADVGTPCSNPVTFKKDALHSLMLSLY